MTTPEPATSDASASASASEQCVGVNLSAVPETMLWTLHNRANEAMKKDGLISDPKAVEIYKSMNFDFERMFGQAENSHALRSLLFDEAVLKFWEEENSSGTVVNFGEGLETQRFRLAEQRGEEGGALWVTVDLPSAIEAREKFIQPNESNKHIGVSALDVEGWAKHIPEDKPLFMTAQGLLMYLEEDDVKVMFQRIAERFPGSTLMFDMISKWLSSHTMKGWKRSEHYTAPQMPFGVNCFDAPPLFQSWVDGLIVEEVSWPSEKMTGVWRYLSPILEMIPIVRGLKPGMVFRVKFPDKKK